MEKYYFDTSIWLDFFEIRDEPNLPKGEWIGKLINKIIDKDDKIIYSDIVKYEMIERGYSINEVNKLFNPLKKVLVYIESNKKQIGKSKDLSLKRNIPKKDALHALIARDNNAILVTLDNHFKEIRDIIQPHNPRDLI